MAAKRLLSLCYSLALLIMILGACSAYRTSPQGFPSVNEPSSLGGRGEAWSPKTGDSGKKGKAGFDVQRAVAAAGDTEKDLEIGINIPAGYDHLVNDRESYDDPPFDGGKLGLPSTGIGGGMGGGIGIEGDGIGIGGGGGGGIGIGGGGIGIGAGGGAGVGIGVGPGGGGGGPKPPGPIPPGPKHPGPVPPPGIPPSIPGIGFGTGNGAGGGIGGGGKTADLPPVGRSAECPSNKPVPSEPAGLRCQPLHCPKGDCGMITVYFEHNTFGTEQSTTATAAPLMSPPSGSGNAPGHSEMTMMSNMNGQGQHLAMEPDPDSITMIKNMGGSELMPLMRNVGESTVTPVSEPMHG